MSVLVTVEAGLRETGWAVFVNGELASTGSVCCPKRSDSDVSKRIDTMMHALDSLVETWHPHEVAFTEVFRNQWPTPALDDLKTALTNWAQRHGLDVHQYTPREIRAGLVGRANAAKEDLAYAVMRRWGLLGTAKSTVEWEAIAAGDYHLRCRCAGSEN